MQKDGTADRDLRRRRRRHRDSRHGCSDGGHDHHDHDQGDSKDMIDDENALRRKGLPVDEYECEEDTIHDDAVDGGEVDVGGQCDADNSCDYYFWEYASSEANEGRSKHKETHHARTPPLSALDYLRAVRYFFSCTDLLK
jgi:hypothetical protein